ncbi:hypothetical protein QO259_05995 [Salinicola sp. JS01]|uniref:hypothetical protein n=1 Tax=Salinicola sp. JS01 TaxID=3050071 RepID=UPI00255C268A|nr:hypothetical protein [Salinicola sp. JS01]WIX34215.1 hypothetical protein QO259_05995 [Salinicola sp. JS01]
MPFYVDINAVTGESDEPPALPGSYTPEDEQQRLGDLAQNARDIGNTLFSAHKGSGQVAGACLVLWSLIVSWQEGAFVDDEEGADWSKIIGSGISVASGAMAGIEGYHKIRMASLGLSTEGAVIGGIKWAFVSDVLGAAGGMISIWDGLKKLTEANEANKTGQSLTGHYGMIVGGVGVLAGIASIVVISASTVVGVFVGLFVGLVTLLVGFIFVTMVSPAVQMWVNRSILGKPSEREDMQVLPFDDMASEQSSLEMVFEGLVVELSWEQEFREKDVDVVSSHGILGTTFKGFRNSKAERSLVKINLKVRVPKLDFMELDVELGVANLRDYTYAWSYKRTGGVSGLSSERKRGQDQSTGSSDTPQFVEVDDGYSMEWCQAYTRKELSDMATLSINLKTSRAALGSSDVFLMELPQ